MFVCVHLVVQVERTHGSRTRFVRVPCWDPSSHLRARACLLACLLGLRMLTGHPFRQSPGCVPLRVRHCADLDRA